MSSISSVNGFCLSVNVVHRLKRKTSTLWYVTFSGNKTEVLECEYPRKCAFLMREGISVLGRASTVQGISRCISYIIIWVHYIIISFVSLWIISVKKQKQKKTTNGDSKGSETADIIAVKNKKKKQTTVSLPKRNHGRSLVFILVFIIVVIIIIISSSSSSIEYNVSSSSCNDIQDPQGKGKKRKLLKTGAQ